MPEGFDIESCSAFPPSITTDEEANIRFELSSLGYAGDLPTHASWAFLNGEAVGTIVTEFNSNTQYDGMNVSPDTPGEYDVAFNIRNVTELSCGELLAITPQSLIDEYSVNGEVTVDELNRAARNEKEEWKDLLLQLYGRDCDTTQQPASPPAPNVQCGTLTVTGDPTEPAFDPASVSVTDTSIPGSASTEQPVTVSGTVQNGNTRAAEADVTLSVDGLELNQQTVTLSGGEVRTVSFDVNFASGGEKSVCIDATAVSEV